MVLVGAAVLAGIAEVVADVADVVVAVVAKQFETITFYYKTSKSN